MAVLADTDDPATATMPHGMLLDSAMLHANWSVREDTDIAVQAGTLRMLGQRRLPSARPGASLSAAWRTKEEVDAFIDARSREGRGPNRRTQAVFRAFSAQLGLFRADPLDAITEARWSALLSDVEPVTVLAKGVEALALSLTDEDGPDHFSDPPVERIGDPLRQRGMRGLGEVFEILADANTGLRRLDREQVERSMALVSPRDAAFGGVWAVRTAIEAFHDCYWGDLTEGFDLLTSEIARLSRAGREQDEPLGGAMLNRARTLMLTKSGAFTAAAYSIEPLPHGMKSLPQARIHLWAGQFEQAVRVAEAGTYEDVRAPTDRSMLKVLRAAAALLNGSCDAGLAAEAVREVRRLLASRNFVPIGGLPQSARSALLELCAPELGDDPNYPLMVARLAELNDAGEHGLRPLHLTERERVLLPLLSTDDRVPEIARKLHVSVNTVRKQVVTLREKFQAGTRAELIRRARNYGALD
jgi:DNA-binding NarL/FixJ family response regulator